MMTKILPLMLSNILLLMLSLMSPVLAEQDQQKSISFRTETAEVLKNTRTVEIEFVGNKIFPAGTLFEQMVLSRNPNQSADLLLAVPVSIEKLEDDLERIRFFLGTMGYLKARIGLVKALVVEDRARLTFEIKEGARFKIGEIAVKGATFFSSPQIVGFSGLVSGEWIDACVIQDKIFKGLKDAYADRGYIQASVDFIPDFKLAQPLALEGVVDITLEVDEGRMFLIERIDFTGKLSERVKANKKKLLDCLLLVDGDVYSRRLLNETLNNLNRLGWFEEIRDKDVIVRTSDRGSTLQIDIQVKEVDSPSRQ